MSEKVFIMAASLTDKRKYTATAIYDGEALVIASVEPIKAEGLFVNWKKPLIAQVQERLSRGHIVLVEEKTDHVAGYATQYLLEDMNDDHEGSKRSNYFDALDWYFALADTGNIHFHADYKKFEISGGGENSMIDRQNDDKGRNVYKVDWKRFHGGYRAVLLCVVAALYEPLSERFLDVMFQSDERARTIESPAHRFKALIQSTNMEKARELEKIREEMP